ncbi:MAG: hypothetical protein LC642_02755, partial [Verrucomicrobiaceae bacterium]|nr:hypothetical protein [Verrucomicrobiaceae bacterium]
MKRKRLLVMGFMGSMPIAGVIWQHIHYIVGLQRLGHDVYYAEDSARLPYNPATGEVNYDFTYSAELLRKLAREFGFQHRWAFRARYLPDCPGAGLSRSKLRDLYREADGILNVCGAQEFNEDFTPSDRCIYIESDPGLEQIKAARGHRATLEHLRGHGVLFTFGENVGARAFPIATRGLKWLPTRQPVLTDLWKAPAPPATAAVFTSIANWSTSGQKDITWRGERYLWSKSRAFLRYVSAPRACGEEFELATEIKSPRTRALFQRNGWRLHNPARLSTNLRTYCEYIWRSKGEFTVAKDQYVRLRTGWFSDRSACYLAAGRPVITQETGFTKHYGNTGGLFAFRSLDEIAEAVNAINADYARHSRAARALAREVFEAEKVLRSLLE